MIDQLRGSLAQHAVEVEPLADPYGRLLVRRRKHRRNLSAGLAALVVLLLLPASLLVTRGFGHPNETGGRTAELTQALLDSPTRGSLAGDTALLAAVKQRVIAGIGGAFGPTPGADLPTSPSQLRVLFAGDIVGFRMVVVGAPGATEVQLWTGPAGAAADALQLEDQEELTPVLRLNARDKSVATFVSTALLLAPAGSTIEYSDNPRFLSDGSVQRTWQAMPDDYLVVDGRKLTQGSRVRVHYGGELLLEGHFGLVITAVGGTGINLPIDRVPGRTSPLAAYAETQTEQWLAAGTAPPGSRLLVLWSAQIPMAGVGTVVIATVSLRTPDGGGPYITWCFDPDGNYRNHPTGQGVLGDPETSLIAMRLPSYTAGGPTDTLQIIAPTGAVRVEVLRGGELVTGGPLQLGVGSVELPQTGAGSVTVRAYSETGAMLAQHSFVDDESSQQFSYERDIVGW